MPETADPFVELAYSHILRRVAAGDSLSQATAGLREMGIPGPIIQSAETKFRLETIAVIQREPKVLRGSSVIPWYAGPQPDDVFWPSLKTHLEQSGKWTVDDLHALDASSTGILSATENPGAIRFNIRGLVIGYVQSGKTASYTSVIAKAADVGYRHFIVVAGTTEKLRRQTQARLQKELQGLNPQRWMVLTSLESDVAALLQQNAGATLSEGGHYRSLLVIKKNATVLRRVNRWFRSAGDALLDRAPILVIDDEADEASINTSTVPGGHSSVNRRMKELTSLARVSYIAYTATPFANLLINPQADDLYPRDFIDDLPRSESYYGPERVFGRDLLSRNDRDAARDGMDVVRVIPDQEISLIKVPSRETRDSFQPTVTESLRTALRWFLLTIACRQLRGQGNEHNTMLVHTSQYTAAHRTMCGVLTREISARLALLASGDEAEVDAFRVLWTAETRAVPATTEGCEEVAWSAVREALVDAYRKCKVVVENANNTGLDYNTKDGTAFIVIGGNVLSRGLTLEGLTASYFIRSAAAYDTLLQMGRWFGYRPGYGDLPRIWMTSELAGYFRDLATVEQEVRTDIQRYRDRNLTPMEFGVRIRTHPSLLVTSRLKQRDAIVVRTSFFGTRPQTILFHHQNESWLRDNLDATVELCSTLRTAAEATLHDGAEVFSGVSAAAIRTFIARYRFHEANRVFYRELALGFIDGANADGVERIASWDVAIIGSTDERAPKVNVGLARHVGMVSRTRLRLRSDPTTADIGALISPDDLSLGLSHEVSGLATAEILKRRAQELPGKALLLVYPINPESTPTKAAEKNRDPLAAVGPMIGIAIAFPESDDEGGFLEHTYIAANLPDIEIDPDSMVEAVDEEEEE